MLITIEEVKKLLSEGKRLAIAADETLLRSLPNGEWIGGTIPYFMTDNGGMISKDKLFVNEMPSFLRSCRIGLYGELDLPKIVEESPDNGFSILILPAFSKVHMDYAQNAPSYDGIFLKSLIGWVAGIHLSDLGSASPKVIAGTTGEFSGSKVAVMHIDIPPEYHCKISTVNIFEQGNGEEIFFPACGFKTTGCLINGKNRNFYDYLLEQKIDTRLPLVADFCGALVNVSIQELVEEEKAVQFYAPVFEGVGYKIAGPVEDYSAKFHTAIPNSHSKPVFACNCILNFLYGELEGKKTGNITGPITFGEIAYQLLNQTMVFLEIDKTI